MVSLDMPPTTGLAFYRKRQTVHSLNNERPQSLQSFYDVMSESMYEINLRVQLLEKTFYGEFEAPEKEIKRWVHAVNSVLKATRTPIIQSLPQLEQINLQVKEMGPARTVDEPLMDKVLESARRILASAEEDFRPVCEDIQTLADFMDKYCLSFCEGDRDPYMETVMAYERQITEFKDTVEENLRNIDDMIRKFRGDGLLFSHFRNSGVAELGYRAACTHAAYLLFFPAACENIRLALVALEKWLSEDKSYVKFIKVDISDLEKQKLGRTKHLRLVQEKSFQLGFKVKANKRLLAEMTEESEKLKDKESHFVEEEKLLMEKHREITLDLELKALRKENLKREATRLSSRELNEKNERLIFETSALKERLQVLMRRLEEMRMKTKWMKGKRELRQDKEAELARLKREHKLVKKEVRAAEVELHRIDNCLNRLKHICLYKTSPDVLKKIFHNIPLPTKRHTAGKPGKTKDPLDKAAKTVARHIDSDWMRLYSSLPFVPQRGAETIKDDLAEVSKSQLRANLEQHAMCSLKKWRRLHTRATAEDLKSTLLEIKREDVVRRVNSALAPRCSVRVKSNRQVRFPNMAPREKKIYKFGF